MENSIDNNKRNFKFNNGDAVKEQITGFTGTITATAFYITGCNQYLVTAKSPNPIKQAKAVWYDEDRLIVQSDIKKEVVKRKSDQRGADIQAPNKG